MKRESIGKFALKSMSYSNIRTLLTLTAIIIGVFSVALLTGISKGTEESVMSKLKFIGTDVITIIPISTQSMASVSATQFSVQTERFTESDIQKILMVEGVKKAIPVLSGTSKMEYKDKEFEVSVYAVSEDADKILTGMRVNEGRWLSTGRFEMVFGSKVNENLGESINIGKKIVLNNRTFTLVGILNETGNPAANLDNLVYIPYETGREFYNSTYGNDQIGAIVVKTSPGYDSNSVGKNIESMLMFYKKINSEDDKWFTVITPAFINSQLDKILGTLNLFFMSVASISIIIGLVGVGNTMYMNVIDRTKEIATMKSIGAKRLEILAIYMFEGAGLGLVGSIVGAAAGMVFGTLIAPWVPFSIEYLQTALAIGFITIGSGVASYIPAKIASGINAAEALRYE
jgi:putative ABC transport system permease protein